MRGHATMLHNNTDKYKKIAEKLNQDDSQCIDPDARYATFSYDVYFSKDDPERPPLPDGWEELFYELDSNIPNGQYFARVYAFNLNATNENSEIVIAHRGTLPSSPGNIWSDLLAVLTLPPAQIDAAASLLKKIQSDLHKFHPTKTFRYTMTGHSLGAVIAELLMARVLARHLYEKNDIDDFMMSSITFEGPGTKAIIKHDLALSFYDQSIIKKTLDIVYDWCYGYSADTNLINSCNEQAIRSFPVLPYTYNYFYDDNEPLPPEEIGPGYATNLYFFFCYTLDQHQMSEIYKKMNFSHCLRLNEVKQQSSDNYGFQATYNAYLDPNSRRKYWDKYLEKCWVFNVSSIQERYRGDYARFVERSYEILQNLHQDSYKISKDSINIEPSGLSQYGIFSIGKQQAELNLEDFVMIDKIIPDKSKTTDESATVSGSKCVIM